MLNRISFKLTVAVIGFAAMIFIGTQTPVAKADSGDLPLPRFVSLASGTVNMRTGPGRRYPIVWVYQRRGMPLEVINQFDNWRKVRDVQGDEGWIHPAMLSGRRYAIIKNKSHFVYDKPLEEADVLAQLKPGVIVRLDSCGEGWCEVSVEGIDGWMPKAALWGVYQQETFE